MRKIAAIAVICTIVIISSCSKKYSNDILATDPATTPSVVMNESISAKATFSFTFGNGTANIIKQAAHSQLSEASADENGDLVYRYTPAANFTGSDDVEIVYTASGATGSGCSGSSGETSGPVAPVHYVIKFNVID